MRTLQWILLFLLIPSLLFGQNVKRINLRGSYGAILPHSIELRPLSQSPVSGLEWQYQVLNTEKMNWDLCNCFHYLGVQLSWHNFGNPDVLGSAFSVSGTFEPILWKKGKVKLSLLTGIGASYLNRVFDPIDNPDNVFFSAPLSFIGFVAPRFEYRLSENWALETALTFNHISNGGQRQPNKGINYLVLGLGVNRYLNLEIFPEFEKEQPSQEIGVYLELGGHSNFSDLAQKRKPSIALLSEVMKPINRIQGLGGGVEMNLDYAKEVDASRFEAFTLAPFVAHHFLFGRVDFSQIMALYLRKPEGINSHTFYQRYILRYRLVSSLHLGFSLKAHGHVAESMDVRLGWKF